MKLLTSTNAPGTHTRGDGGIRINRNTQPLRLPVDLLRGTFVAQVSRDNVGTNTISF